MRKSGSDARGEGGSDVREKRECDAREIRESDVRGGAHRVLDEGGIL